MNQLGHARHFKIICFECDKVMAQCRCFDANKNISYEVCNECSIGKKSIQKKHPALIVLSSLFAGCEVSLMGLDVAFDDDYQLTIPAYNEDGTKRDDIRLAIDYGDIGCFIRSCEMLSQDELAVIAAQTTLTKLKTRE